MNHVPEKARPLRRAAIFIVAALTAAFWVAIPAAAGTTDWARAQALVQQMTLDEKISFVTGATDPQSIGESGYIAGVPRLGIPPLRLADGSAGVRITAPATAMPAPISLASAFDQGTAGQYGSVLGREGRALGADVVLAPMVNAIRVPQGGRNFETYSEDPLVSSRTTVGVVTGIQGQGAMASVKHFAANNQETDRTSLDVDIDQQTLHEIELPPFKAAVDAGVASVMCAYNGVNGEPSCGNAALLNDTLRGQWGFSGWTVSDWQATPSTAAILDGLDQEMPAPVSFGPALKTAVQNGRVAQSVLDTAVTRIVAEMARFHLLDRPAAARPPLQLDADATVARTVAERGAVLLRNEEGLLPLTGSHATSLALIGPAAKTPKIGGEGSSQVVPATAASAPLDTIKVRAGAQATVTYTPGIDLVGTPTHATPFSPAPAMDADGALSLAADGSTDYRGTLTVPATGDYRFTMGVSGAAGGVALLSIDGQTQFFVSSVPTIMRMHLGAGSHTVGIIRLPGLGDGPIEVIPRWVTPDQVTDFFAPAVAAARQAQTAVVFATDDEAEGADRGTLDLPDYQNDLIDAVASANPNTVVVLETGSAVAMPWLGKVRSVLEMWYPGEKGAEATTRLLYGDASPSGRLTQTFPTSDAATPVAGDPSRFPGVGGEVHYSEGIYTGYRWYDKNNVRPLFPFGFGLDYTSFNYRDLTVSWNGQLLAADFTVTNTGGRAGTETPQVYLSASPDLAMPQAVHSLGGYQKVTLAPGASQHVHVTVGAAQLSSWSTTDGRFVLGTGHRTVYAGPSSADLGLHQDVTITATAK